MNILILNWRDPRHPLGGGAEISLFEHAKYWVKKGANVTWISAMFLHAKKEEDIDGIHIRRFGSHFTVHARAMWYLHFLNGKKKYDIFIDSFHFVPFFTPLYIDRKKIVALINEPAKNLWFKNLLFPFSFIGYALEPYFFSIYKKTPFITAASSIAEELRGFGIAGEYIHVIHHGISRLHEPEKKVSFRSSNKLPVMYLSQLSKDKGIEDAVHAIERAYKVDKRLIFWVVGRAIDTRYEAHIRSILKNSGIDMITTRFGFVSEEKKTELLTHAFLLIHPSIREGWGLNVIEANTVGTPAIGYNVTGLKDSIVDKKTGILTEKNNPEALAREIIKLSSDIDRYEQLSSNAKEWSKKFSWEKTGNESWQFIEECYERQRASNTR